LGALQAPNVPPFSVMLQRPHAVLLAFILFGCSRGESSPKRTDSAAGTVSPSSVSDVDENRVDPEAAAAQSLLRELADRDEALLEMARSAVTRREQLEVSSDARRMLAEQRRESNRLLGILKGEYQETHKPKISAQDQTLIDSLNGVGAGEFDRTFRHVVARHDEGDAQLIEASRSALGDSRATAERSRRASEAERSSDAEVEIGQRSAEVDSAQPRLRR